jgi:hypothetical protein
MNWLIRKLVRWLLGPAAVDGVSDEVMDGITLAIHEEAARLNHRYIEVIPGSVRPEDIMAARLEEIRLNGA